ncbi:MAG: peptide deformylase, partial [Actinomycetota bacterium]|nr:peptide deformylase [Actinomycetota bacterium]
MLVPPLPDGRVRAVLRAPAAALSSRSGEVDPVADEVVTLAADLVATQRAAAGCVGLAAPQIGVAARVFSVDVTGHPKTRQCHGLVVLVNPVVEAASRSERAREGCLSVPDLTGDVRRPGRLRISGLLPGSGAVVTLETDAFEARAFQHEIDHLDGLLFLDRVTGAHA